MSADLAPIVSRLGRFIRLLDSDNDAECLGAARALGRALRGVGEDFHTLARIVETSAASDNHGSVDARAMAHWIIASGARLSETERSFVHSMANWRNEPTERQANWLMSIFERVSSSERRRA